MKSIDKLLKDVDVDKLIEVFMNQKGKLLDIIMNFKNPDVLDKNYSIDDLLQIVAIISDMQNITLIAIHNLYIKQNGLK